MENKTPEEIYNKIKGVIINGQYVDENDNVVDVNFEDWFLKEVEEYGKQQYAKGEKDGYNQGVKDCIENAEVCFTEDCVIVRGDAEIDEDSMKKLLKQ